MLHGNNVMTLESLRLDKSANQKPNSMVEANQFIWNGIWTPRKTKVLPAVFERHTWRWGINLLLYREGQDTINCPTKGSGCNHCVKWSCLSESQPVNITGVSEESFRQCPTSTLLFLWVPNHVSLPGSSVREVTLQACALVSEPLGLDQSASYEQLCSLRVMTSKRSNCSFENSNGSSWSGLRRCCWSISCRRTGEYVLLKEEQRTTLKAFFFFYGEQFALSLTGLATVWSMTAVTQNVI